MDAINAVVSIGTNKAQYIHRIPPEVLSQTEEIVCASCGQCTLFVSRTLAVTRGAARKAGRELVLVCNQCSNGLVDQAAALATFLDPEISKPMLKHHAEMN